MKKTALQRAVSNDDKIAMMVAESDATIEEASLALAERGAALPRSQA